MRAQRYASFNTGKGAKFDGGKMTLEELAAHGKEVGEPKQISGKQELYEALVNRYI